MVHYSDSSGDEEETGMKEKGRLFTNGRGNFKAKETSPQPAAVLEFNAKIRFKYRGTVLIWYVYSLLRIEL